jgi:hypothetical protein
VFNYPGCYNLRESGYSESMLSKTVTAYRLSWLVKPSFKENSKPPKWKVEDNNGYI